jgi:hypothetical protein
MEVLNGYYNITMPIIYLAGATCKYDMQFCSERDKLSSVKAKLLAHVTRLWRLAPKFGSKPCTAAASVTKPDLFSVSLPISSRISYGYEKPQVQARYLKERQ